MREIYLILSVLGILLLFFVPGESRKVLALQEKRDPEVLAGEIRRFLDSLNYMSGEALPRHL